MSTLSIATAKEVFDLLRDDLAAIEQEFLKQSESPVEVVTDIAQYLMSGGGKRIRPLLLLLSAKSLGCTTHSRIRLGAVVEMLHRLATSRDVFVYFKHDETPVGALRAEALLRLMQKK